MCLSARSGLAALSPKRPLALEQEACQSAKVLGGRWELLNVKKLRQGEIVNSIMLPRKQCPQADSCHPAVSL